ncbi:MAG TPA: aspartyl/asparaginyl beta-hydroxylase domain-containing protein [Sphingomicrobium sp.]
MAGDRKSEDSWLIRFGKKTRPALNRWIAKKSLIPTTPVLNPFVFDWAERVQASWRDIQAECDALLEERSTIPAFGEISPHHRRVAVDNSWRSFFFEAHGYRLESNRSRCPKTAALLDTIPDLVTAFYSVMEPGTHVPRHKGITKALINVHLGLRVPAGKDRCRIRIDGEDHGWTEGKLLAIDDTFPHEVWNDSSEARALLFIQVLRPMRAPARLLGKLIVEAATYTTYVQQARRILGATRGQIIARKGFRGRWTAANLHR